MDNSGKKYGMNYIVQCTEEWEKSDLQVKQHEMGSSLRALIDAIRWIDVADPRAMQAQVLLDKLVEMVQSSVDRIEQPQKEDLVFGRLSENQVRNFADHELVRGPASYLYFPINILSTEIDIENRDCSIHGTIEFPAISQGWPGVAHGGMIAQAFDTLMPTLMRHLNDLTQGADSKDKPAARYTANLSVDYCANTPVEKELDFAVYLERFDEPRKIFLESEISHEGKVTAKATSLWVIVQ